MPFETQKAFLSVIKALKRLRYRNLAPGYNGLPHFPVFLMSLDCPFDMDCIVVLELISGKPLESITIVLKAVKIRSI